MTDAANTSNSAPVSCLNAHAHATAAAFAMINDSKNSSLPWRLNMPDSRPAKA